MISEYPWSFSTWETNASVICLPINDSFVIKRGIPRGTQQYTIPNLGQHRNRYIFVFAEADGCYTISKGSAIFVEPPQATCGPQPKFDGVCAAPDYSKNSTVVDVIMNGWGRTGELYYCHWPHFFFALIDKAALVSFSSY